MRSGQNYAQGVAIYETLGGSRVVLTALRVGETTFTRQKLKAVLNKLLDEKNVRVVDTSVKRVHETPKRVPIAPKVVSPPEKVVSSPKKVASSPEVEAQRRAWFAERNHLHPQLELVATDAERLAMSLRILELADLITQSYAADPAPVAVHLATPGLAMLTEEGEIRRLLANLRPQRTKLNKRPERATDLAQVELDIKCLEEKLKRDGGEPKLQ